MDSQKEEAAYKKAQMPGDMTETVAHMGLQLLSRSQQQKPCCCKGPAHINKHKTHERLLQF